MEEEAINAREWRQKYLELKPWNRYQRGLFETVKNHRINVAVRARAGTGKTTTIIGVVAALPGKSKIAIMAFNKHIADNLEKDKRLPKNRVTCSTAHRCGLSLLRRYFQGLKPEVKPNKYQKIAKDIVSEIVRLRSRYEIEKTQLELGRLSEIEFENIWGKTPPPYFDESTKKGKTELKLFVRFIEQMAKYAMKTLTPLDVESLSKMMVHYDIQYPNVPGVLKWGIESVARALEEGERMALELRTVSFEEMLYLVWKWKLKPPRKDWVIVDEAQDASPSQIALYEAYVRQGANIIYVGDDRQSIMGFSGADTNSWFNLADKFKPLELPLSICYRCPQSHLQLARRIVPDIESNPQAPTGEIKVIHPEKLQEEPRAEDLIVCRLTAPLISLCLKLLILNKPAAVRGREIGEELITIAQKARAYENWPRGFLSQINIYFERLLAPAIKDDNEELIERLNDQKNALVVFWQAYGYLPTFEDFCEKVKSLFNDKDNNGLIVLSTIHRAKGDEANRVFIYGSQLLPFTFKSSQGWQIQQEMNITYVALTRAKQTLFLVPIVLNDRDKANLKSYLKHSLGGMKLPAQPPEQPKTSPNFHNTREDLSQDFEQPVQLSLF